MNEIILKGLIRDIENSHNIGDIQYSKANLIVSRDSGIDDIISLRFKKFSNNFEPACEDFSGWNCTPMKLSLATAQENVSPYVVLPMVNPPSFIANE